MVLEIVDNGNVLTSDERKELAKYLLEKCRTTTRDIDWLRRITVRSDERSGYLGYWTARVVREHGHVRDFDARIFLNSWYLKTLEGMKRTLAHEYGHHWTLGHLVMLDCFEGEADLDSCRLPWGYYRMRRLSTNDVLASRGQWERCDKEIIAEDYRLLFTPNNDPHAMEGRFGNPSTEVGDYIRTLCYRRPR